MANKVVNLLGDDGHPVPIEAIDEGDGTYRLATGLEDGDDATQGAKADAAASSSTAEDTTERSGISLWKGIKNILILIKTALTPTGAAGTFCGRIAVTTAGTAVQGGDVATPNGVLVRSLAANTGKMYVWNATGDGRANGYELNASESVFASITNLNQLWVDASVSGEKICWIRL